MFGVTPTGSCGSPAGGSPARGTKHPATPSSSDSSASPQKLPHLSLPACGRGAGRGAGRGKPVGTVNPQPQGAQRKLGQAGFVQHGGSNVRGAARSSPQLTLPSFSTEEEDEEEEGDNDDDKDDEDDDDEVQVHDKDELHKQENSQDNRLLLRT